MLSRDEHSEVITKIRDTIGEQNSALISDELLDLVANYDSIITEIGDKNKEVEDIKEEKEKIKQENEELLKVNGKLFQKVTTKIDDINDEIKDKKEDEEISIDEIIDEKGNFIE